MISLLFDMFPDGEILVLTLQRYTEAGQTFTKVIKHNCYRNTLVFHITLIVDDS